eukprot:4730903-Alexandrium_andersonii.AAC.1
MTANSQAIRRGDAPPDKARCVTMIARGEDCPAWTRPEYYHRAAPKSRGLKGRQRPRTRPSSR